MKILITASTLPAHDQDPVPGFVRDQAIHLREHYPDLEILLHAPHNFYSRTKGLTRHRHYTEVRFHYFWPHRFERLAGRGILPALRENKLLYVQVPFLFLFHFLSLLRWARREKPHLIYAHWFTPQAISAAVVSRLTNTPFVFTTHSSDVSVLKPFPFSTSLIAAVCRQARAYTSVSRRTWEKLQDCFPVAERDVFAQKHVLLPMGVSLQHRGASVAGFAPVASTGTDGDQFMLLFLGRLTEKKGVTYLIQALRLLPANLLGRLKVVIAGDGHLLDPLKREAARVDSGSRVSFAGFVHSREKEELLEKADVVCIPSIIAEDGDAEGLPVVLMEALAAGKLVLASTSSGAEDILTDGVDGYLFPQRCPEAIAKKLQQIMSEPLDRRAGVRAMAMTTANRFDWDRINLKYHTIFVDAVKR